MVADWMAFVCLYDDHHGREFTLHFSKFQKLSGTLLNRALMIDDLKNRHGSLLKHQNEGIKNFTLFGFDNDETKVYG